MSEYRKTVNEMATIILKAKHGARDIARESQHPELPISPLFYALYLILNDGTPADIIETTAWLRQKALACASARDAISQDT